MKFAAALLLLFFTATTAWAWTHGKTAPSCLEYQANGCLLYNAGTVNKILVHS